MFLCVTAPTSIQEMRSEERKEGGGNEGGESAVIFKLKGTSIA